MIEQAVQPGILDLHSEQLVPSKAYPVAQDPVSHFPDPAEVQELQFDVQAAHV